MKKWIFLILLTLGGCNDDGRGDSPSEPDDDPPSFDFNFDQETPGGIQIESRGHDAGSLEAIDTMYESTMQCVEDQFTALSIPGFDEYDAPPIILEDDLSELCGSGGNGIYCTNYEIPFIGIRPGVSYSVWQHEFIHHILFMNDFDNEMNLNHEPIEIWNCQF